MNTQNILNYFGINLDVSLDSSEYYDYEIADNYSDYNKDVIDFTTPIEYEKLIFNGGCLDTHINDLKPLSIEIDVPYTGGTCDFTTRKRTEKGWTLDFVFNRDSLDWVSGGTFYYWGIVDEIEPDNYADNNLSFSFTEDGRIAWEAYRFSGYCDTESGYTNNYYITSGATPILCSGGTSNNFNISIVFTRYIDYYDCDIENEGGANDYITGYTVTNTLDVLTGATEDYVLTDVLSRKWEEEKHKRLGTLKIYLNGRPIYKVEDWEEVIPSKRESDNPIMQIFGGGTTGSGDLHLGDTNFIIRNVKYFEEPLDFVNIRHHYLSLIKPFYNITECTSDCVETPVSIYFTPVLPPVAGNSTLSIDRDTMNNCSPMEGWSPLSMHFPYTDPDNGNLIEIEILTVPTGGNLYVGFLTTLISPNFIISGASLTNFITYSGYGLIQEAYTENILFRVKTDSNNLYSENIGVLTIEISKCT